jgi:hypothetical protein
MHVRPVEQRRSRRIRTTLTVHLTDGRGTRRGNVVDVSHHGLFVALHDLPANRHLVQLVIHLPGGDIDAAATVARRDLGRGVGLALFVLAGDARARWDAFVQASQQAALQQGALQQGALRNVLPGPHPADSVPAPVATGGPRPTAPAGSSSTATSMRPAGGRVPADGGALSGASTFYLRLRTVERLHEYRLLHVEAGGTILFTPVPLLPGTPVTLLAVHPGNGAEFPLPGRVQRAVATPPKHLEIVFRPVDVDAFARFIDGVEPPTTTTGDEEIVDFVFDPFDDDETTIDDASACAAPARRRTNDEPSADGIWLRRDHGG